jgi:hypothetical protein
VRKPVTPNCSVAIDAKNDRSFGLSALGEKKNRERCQAENSPLQNAALSNLLALLDLAQDKWNEPVERVQKFAHCQHVFGRGPPALVYC